MSYKRNPSCAYVNCLTRMTCFRWNKLLYFWCIDNPHKSKRDEGSDEGQTWKPIPAIFMVWKIRRCTITEFAWWKIVIQYGHFFSDWKRFLSTRIISSLSQVSNIWHASNKYISRLLSTVKPILFGIK